MLPFFSVDRSHPFSGESLLASLAQAPRRAADIVARRGGLALARGLGLPVLHN